MCNLKVLLFLSLFFFEIIFIKGQNNDCFYNSVCQKEIDSIKFNIYKSILLSKEIQSDDKCHIVLIQLVSLSMNFSSQIGFFNIKEEKKDSISIINLRNYLPKSYWIYPIEYKLSNSVQKYELISQLQKIDSLYTPRYLEDICLNSFDVIKIQEPLDNWMNIYQENISKGNVNANVVIPVIYESYMNKPKYLLYKIELYEGSTKVKSVKAIEL